MNLLTPDEYKKEFATFLQPHLEFIKAKNPKDLSGANFAHQVDRTPIRAFEDFFAGMAYDCSRFVSLEYIPIDAQDLRKCGEELVTIRNCIEELLVFWQEKSNKRKPPAQRDRLIITIITTWMSAHSKFGNALNVTDPPRIAEPTKLAKDLIKDKIGEWETDALNAKELVNNANAYLKDSVEKSEEIISTAKDKARQVAVATEEQSFRNEACKHFAVFILSVIAGIGVSMYFLYEANNFINLIKDKYYTDALPLIVVRSMSAGLTILWITIALRAAMAGLHGWAVNRHRMTALNAYKVFLAANSDPTVHDAILMQVATAVFMPSVSGFIKNEPDSTDPSKLASKIGAEVLKGASKNADGTT